MNPSALVTLANLQRRRRADTAPRAPFATVGRARRALAEDGMTITVLTQGDLPNLSGLANAVSELADCLAFRRPQENRAIHVINELASGCTGTVQLSISGRAAYSDMGWHDPDPVAGLARRVIEELDGTDLNRLRQCQRKECDLLFYDMTRSRSQRWHAEKSLRMAGAATPTASHMIEDRRPGPGDCWCSPPRPRRTSRCDAHG